MSASVWNPSTDDSQVEAIILAKLADYASALKGAGLVGFAEMLAYEPNTVGAKLKSLQDQITASSVLGSNFFVNVKDTGAIGDGVTDDTVAIQAALAVTGRIFVPGVASWYRISQSITLPSANCEVRGESRNNSRLKIYSSSAPVIVGAANSIDTVISNIVVDREGVPSTTGNGFELFAAAEGMRLVDCKAVNQWDGFSFGRNLKGRVSGCESKENYRHGFYWAHTVSNTPGEISFTDCTAFNNEETGFRLDCTTSTAVSFYALLSNCVSHYNKVGADIRGQAPLQTFALTNCSFSNNNQYGIISTAAAFKGTLAITNCQVSRIGRYTWGRGRNNASAGSSPSIIIAGGNAIIADCFIEGSNGIGISIGVNSRANIIGNQLSLYIGAGEYIAVAAAAVANLIGNQILNLEGVRAGEGITHAGKGAVIGNSFDTGFTDPLKLAGFTGVVRNNQGVPVIAPAALTPTAGAATWVYTAGAYPESIYIRGGTCTIILYEGVQIGTVTPAVAAPPMLIRLEPYESLSITYSVPPTNVIRKIHI